MEQHMTVNPSAHLVAIVKTEEDIRLHWRFTALMPVDQARQRLQEYFAELGYRLDRLENGTLIMQRGPGIWSLNASPRCEEAKLFIDLTPSISQTTVVMELHLDKGYCEEVCRLYAWELVEAEQYLHGKPVNFEGMDRLDCQIQMRVFRTMVSGLLADLFLISAFVEILFRVLRDVGTERWLLDIIIVAVGSTIIFWLSMRAKRLALRSKKP